jgi:hypothetical protein
MIVDGQAASLYAKIATTSFDAGKAARARTP